MAKNFTVLWGQIGDDCEQRMDHVTTESDTPSHTDVMDAAWVIAYAESGEDPNDIDALLNEDGEPILGIPGMTFEEFKGQSYTGSAIFDGHLVESRLSFS